MSNSEDLQKRGQLALHVSFCTEWNFEAFRIYNIICMSNHAEQHPSSDITKPHSAGDLMVVVLPMMKNERH